MALLSAYFHTCEFFSKYVPILCIRLFFSSSTVSLFKYNLTYHLCHWTNTNSRFVISGLKGNGKEVLCECWVENRQLSTAPTPVHLSTSATQTLPRYNALT